MPSLWVMKMIALPASRSCGRCEEILDLLRCQHGGRLVEDQHVGERNSTLMISTRCWMPTGRSRSARRGRPPAHIARSISPPAARRVEIEIAELARRLDAQHHVLGHREDRHQHEVLVHHADARVDRIARAVEDHRLAVDQDLALVGAVEPRRARSSASICPRRSRREGPAPPRRGRQVHALIGDTAPKRLVMPRSSMSMPPPALDDRRALAGAPERSFSRRPRSTRR
jgi:hypothetical protein